MIKYLRAVWGRLQSLIISLGSEEKLIVVAFAVIYSS